MRRAIVLLVFATVLTGCGAGTLGLTTPECGDLIPTSTILQIQAVPTAAFVPCIQSLPIGWEYNHLRARSGLSEFTLDSDRMGDGFMEVRTTETCDIGGAQEVPAPQPDIRLYVDLAADLTVPMVFIPEGPTEATIDAAQAIVTGLVGDFINGKKIDVVIDRTQGPTADRIQNARADGAHVFVIGLREAEEGTVTVLIAGREGEATTTVDEALHMIQQAVSPASYRGSWFHVFEGGCITYRFDADGPETHDLEQRVRETLGYTDADAVRELGRSVGFDI